MNSVEVSRLLVSYFDSWYSVLVRYASGTTVDLDLAEDLVQDVYVRLFSELRRGKAIKNPKAWLLCVLRHEIGKELSRRAREVLDASPARTNAVCSPPADEGPAVESQVETDDVADLLSVLTPREQDVMLLRMTSLKYREIAERLGISPSAVNTLLARAIRKLRKAANRESWSIRPNVVKGIPKTLQ